MDIFNIHTFDLTIILTEYLYDIWNTKNEFELKRRFLHAEKEYSEKMAVFFLENTTNNTKANLPRSVLV